MIAAMRNTSRPKEAVRSQRRSLRSLMAFVAALEPELLPIIPALDRLQPDGCSLDVRRHSVERTAVVAIESDVD